MPGRPRTGTGSDGGKRHRSAFTVIELLIVVGVITLLVGITVPTLGHARHQSRAIVCAANLRSVGQVIHEFANSHDDYVAPAVAFQDYWWGRGDQVGWDIETGTWAQIPGGRQSIWRCPGFGLPFVGNARALGLWYIDARPYRVGLRQWYEPGRLALAYDLQPNLTETVYQHALDPTAGDLSDESYIPWPREPRPTLPFRLDRYGPHAEGYTVLFADGHARTTRAWATSSEAVYWSGPRWWK